MTTPKPNPNPSYGHPRFPGRCLVRVADRTTLESYMRPGWRYHHPVVSEQLQFSGKETSVRGVFYYFGGDRLYTLEDTGNFMWHENCLRPIEEAADERDFEST